MKRRTSIAVFALTAWAALCVSTVIGVRSVAGATLPQSVGPILAREFGSGDISYLLVDASTRQLVAGRWENSAEPTPIGSLAKPFTAIAYAEAHAFQYPEFTCAPGACWYPRGHGKLDIVHAVALSCNAYFHQLAAGVKAAQVMESARRVGLQGPAVGADLRALTGERGEWKEAPDALVRAYAELIARRSQVGVRPVIEGMSQSARAGTAAAIARETRGAAVLAKTGTAPCTHADHAPGDGFTVAAWPAESPRYVLLVRLHGHPGAQAAEVAGKMIRALEP